MALISGDHTSGVDVPVASPRSEALPHFYNLDVIRAVSIVLVVILHVAAILMYSFNDINHSSWWAANIFDSLARPCVPLFLMVSGFLLLDPRKTESPGSFFRKRLLRLGVPMLVWVLIYLFWNVSAHGQAYTLTSAVIAIVTGPVYFHLWFLYYLAGIYLVTPLLRVYCRQASFRSLLYFFLLWVVAVAIYPLVQFTLGIAIGLTITVTTGMVGYFIAGPMLRQVSIGPRGMAVAVAAWVASVAFTAVETYSLTVQNGGVLNEFFFNYTSLNIIIMACATFLILNAIPFAQLLAGHRWIKAVIDALSRRTLGIYLVHVIVLELLRYQSLVPRYGTSSVTTVLVILALAVVTLALSTLVVAVLERIPLLHRIVGV